MSQDADTETRRQKQVWYQVWAFQKDSPHPWREQFPVSAPTNEPTQAALDARVQRTAFARSRPDLEINVSIIWPLDMSRDKNDEEGP